MNVMTHFTLRSLKQHRKWTVVTVIGIAISAAMITAVSAFIVSFMGLMQNATISTNGNWHAEFAGVNAKQYKAIQKADFVGQAMLTKEIGYAKLEGSRNAQRPYLYIKQYDKAAQSNFPTVLVSGRMPKSSDELAVSQAALTDARVKLKVGQKLTLAVGDRSYKGKTGLSQNDPYNAGGKGTPGESLTHRFTKTYTVVGIIKTPGFEHSYSSCYYAVSYISALKPGDTADALLLEKNLGHDVFTQAKALARKIGVKKNNISFNNDLLRYCGVVSGDATQSTLYGFATVLILIIMLASIALIYNAFAISVSERTRQLGMLASVGATRKQKRHSIFLEAFIVAIIGIPLGILAGIAGAGVTILIVSPIIDSSLNMGSAHLTLMLSPQAILAAVVFSALTIFVSALIPALRASRITPIEAIRMSKEVKLKSRHVRTSWLTRLLFGFEGELALKNLKRNRKKYRATVLSLAISLVLFLTVSFYAQEMGDISQAAMYGVNYDFSVVFGGGSLASQQSLSRKIKAIPEVKRITELKETACLVSMKKSQLTQNSLDVNKTQAGKNHYDISAQINAPDDASFTRYAKSVGVNPKDYENPNKPRVIIINYGTYAQNGIHDAGAITTVAPGTPLPFEIDTGKNKETKNKSVVIGALTEKRPMGILKGNLVTVVAVTSRKCLSAFVPKNERVNETENLYLTTNNEAKLQKQLTAVTNQLPHGQVYVANIAEIDRREANAMLVLGIFVYGFIILISLICVANIFNTITTSMGLRRKEFAMLRSVGMTPRGISKMLRFESVFYGLNGLLFGIPISIGVALLLYHLQEGAVSMGFHLPLFSYCFAVVLIFLIVLSTMLYSGAKIKRDNIVDTLKEDLM